mmetsp:Transcript_13985/g.26855  ORF Transcript_13985/g.26855 Transcript_13985/m.26855 type:complete len:201 (+) Transcript_13985:7151-7753(+)
MPVPVVDGLRGRRVRIRARDVRGRVHRVRVAVGAKHDEPDAGDAAQVQGKLRGGHDVHLRQRHAPRGLHPRFGRDRACEHGRTRGHHQRRATVKQQSVAGIAGYKRHNRVLRNGESDDRLRHAHGGKGVRRVHDGVAKEGRHVQGLVVQYHWHEVHHPDALVKHESRFVYNLPVGSVQRAESWQCSDDKLHGLLVRVLAM